MDFDFSPEQVAFREEVERFLDEHDDPEVFDLRRENMAQICDTPKRRAFMGKVAEKVPFPFAGTGVPFSTYTTSTSKAASAPPVAWLRTSGIRI